jgi:hypothetical protein
MRSDRNFFPSDGCDALWRFRSWFVHMASAKTAVVRGAVTRVDSD